MSVRDEYNRIAQDYKKTKGKISIQYALYHSFSKNVTCVKNKSVIDLACGAGFSTRMISCLGHKRLVGVDISEEQIGLAKEQEAKEPKGIEYHLGNIEECRSLESLGKFDLATAVFLLNYAGSTTSLNRILRNIRSLLGVGGLFVGVIPNPNIGIMYKRYGIEFIPIEDISDGAKYKVILYGVNKRKIVDFINFWYSMKTYKSAFLRAKFHVKFYPIKPSMEGINKFGRCFWTELKERPSHLVFVARAVNTTAQHHSL